ncbi:DUF2637 domain-containing protein [Micromonospora sp. NPDC005197]|uniref:DUF2637 domain-containing protein n=1 Tax=Micromonospora sp. NPDC005197 TaxID=3157020 RepID=UPI0033BABA84
MNPRRIASLAGTVAVTTIAAVASYDHMKVLAERAGQPPTLAALLPLSVDGMILVATLALGDGRRSRWSAWLAFVLGVAASVVANVAVAPPSATARVVSAWPAVALLLTVEVLARSGKAAPSPAPVAPVAAAVAAPSPAPVAPVAVDTPPATPPANVTASAIPPAVAGTAARVAALVAARPHLSAADVAAALGVSARTARRHLATTRAALAAG